MSARWHLVSTNQVSITLLNSSSEDWLVEIESPLWLQLHAEDPDADTFRLVYTPSTTRKLYLVLRRAFPDGLLPWDATYTLTAHVNASLAGKRIDELQMIIRAVPVSLLLPVNDAEQWSALFCESSRCVLAEAVPMTDVKAAPDTKSNR